MHPASFGVRRGPLWRLAGRLRHRLTSSRVKEPPQPPEVASEFSAAELRQFLEGDVRGAPAAPDFRERLRRELWARVERRSTPEDRS